uniref:Uncharacterized protein n=1 Tax=Oncorhynchus mykiss TaxID=8022 RepID=A0A8K9WX81_ONCMY
MKADKSISPCSPLLQPSRHVLPSYSHLTMFSPSPSLYSPTSISPCSPPPTSISPCSPLLHPSHHVLPSYIHLTMFSPPTSISPCSPLLHPSHHVLPSYIHLTMFSPPTSISPSKGNHYFKVSEQVTSPIETLFSAHHR